MQVSATDLDTGNNARLKYCLQSSELFHVNPNIGWISLAGQLDREIIDHYHLLILAIDSSSPPETASTSVLVSLIDDNDNVPRFERDFYAFELLESLPAGAYIGAISASDPDLGENASLSYAVIQANSSISMNFLTGEFFYQVFYYFSVLFFKYCYSFSSRLQYPLEPV